METLYNCDKKNHIFTSILYETLKKYPCYIDTRVHVNHLVLNQHTCACQSSYLKSTRSYLQFSIVVSFPGSRVQSPPAAVPFVTVISNEKKDYIEQLKDLLLLQESKKKTYFSILVFIV